MRAELRGDVEQPAEGAAATGARRGACAALPVLGGGGRGRPARRPGLGSAGHAFTSLLFLA